MINVTSMNVNKFTDIQEYVSFEDNCIKNRIWYRGDPSEIEQYFKQLQVDNVSKSRFWASVPSEGTIRKFHTGIYSIIIDTLVNLILSDFQRLESEETTLNEWQEIADDNSWDSDLLRDAITDTLVVGDGVFKISYDPEISKHPIVEFVSGEDVEIITKRSRVVEYRFYSYFAKKDKKYKLIESYKKNAIDYKLVDEHDNDVDLNSLEETQDLTPLKWNGDYFLCVPMRFYKSPKHNDRGMALLDRKSDNIDALDEVVSQWIEAIRDGRVKTYIPESMLPKNPETGEVMRHNAFDNKFIKTQESMKEISSDAISQVQADINYNAFVESYASMLDLILQGVVSPSTLGIDLKKTDNADAQREKEKTTLTTRGKIVDTLIEVIPRLINTVLKCKNGISEKPTKYTDVEIKVVFGEYASPSFNDKVIVLKDASASNIMSIEKIVEELWGDSLSDKEKSEEVERIKQLRGLVQAEEEPDDIHNFNDNEELEDEDVE